MKWSGNMHLPDYKEARTRDKRKYDRKKFVFEKKILNECKTRSRGSLIS